MRFCFLLVFSIINYLTEAYNISSYQIVDLSDNIVSDKALWTFSGASSFIKTTSTTIGNVVYEGGSTARGATYSTLYTGLPKHNFIYLSFGFHLSGSWSTSTDFAYITIDGVTRFSAGITNCVLFVCPTCTAMMTLVLPHTNTSLGLSFRSKTSGATSSMFCGVGEIQILFVNSTTITNPPYFIDSPIKPSGTTSYPTSSCHASCRNCYASSSTACLSCATGYYYYAGSCLKYPCASGFFYTWAGTCVTTCASPLVQSRTNEVVLTCVYPCLTTEFLHSDGVCRTSCPSPLTTTVYLSRNLCSSSCAAGTYIYYNKTCKSTCMKPFFPSTLLNYYSFCTNCSSTQWYAYNQTCINSCPATANLISSTIEIFKVCNLNCSQYYFYNDTCAPTCPSPLISGISGTQLTCNFPCNLAQNMYLYTNGSCKACNPPFIKVSLYGGLFCQFPCVSGSANPIYLYNGTCISTCDPPLIQVNDALGIYCNNPCSNLNYYYYPNGTCYSTCPYPMKSSLFFGVRICDFPCENSSDYFYSNGSCLPICQHGNVPVSAFYGLGCVYPCDTTLPVFAVWNETCIASCPAPLVLSSILTEQYCDNPCAYNFTYIYFNQTCQLDCPAPFIPGRVANNSCEFPCDYPNGEYYLYNGSCAATCDSLLDSSSSSLGNFCDFQCNYLTEYLYWNGSCLPTCPAPFISAPVWDRNYCNFPCGGATPFFMGFGYCNCTCELPFINRDSLAGSFCEFPCANKTHYLYQNGSCLPYCPLNMKEVDVFGYKFCNIICPMYTAPNQSCVDWCDYPLVPKPVPNITLCSNPCNDTTQFYYAAGFCASFCLPPYRQTILQGVNYCDVPCPSPSDYYVSLNGTCQGNCNFPFNTSNILFKACVPPCNSTSFYYIEKKQCVVDCSFPDRRLSGEIEFCLPPCDPTAKTADQEECARNFLSSMNTLGTPSFDTLQRICQRTSDFMNTMTFSSGCKSSGIFSEGLMSTTLQILSTVSTMLQAMSLTSSNYTSISTANFDIGGKVMNDCDLVEHPIPTADAVPEVRLSPKNGSCSNTTVNMSYIALSDSLTTCGANKSTSKGTIMMSIVNSKTGASLLDTFTATVKMALGAPCPKGCPPKGSVCFCENTNVFDVASQIKSLFANSNINKIDRIDKLNEWKFYQDPVFWVLVGLYSWFLFTIVLVKTKLRDVCCYQDLTRKRRKIGKFRALFQVVHPLIQIYVFKSPLFSKVTNAFLYTFRILSMLTFASIFKTPDNNTIGSLFNPYIICLPYATIVPLNGILASIVSLPNKKNLADQRMARRANIRIKVGIGVILLLICGFTLIIFILAANQESSDKLPWVFNFFKVIVQDSILSPFLLMAQYFLIFKLSKTFKTSKFFGKIYNILMERYIEIILKGPTKKKIKDLTRTSILKIPENIQTSQHIEIPEVKSKFKIR